MLLTNSIKRLQAHQRQALKSRTAWSASDSSRFKCTVCGVRKQASPHFAKYSECASCNSTMSWTASCSKSQQLCCRDMHKVGFNSWFSKLTSAAP